MKKIIIAVLGIILAGIAIYFIFFSGEKQQVVVETTPVKRATISTTVTATGTVEPINEIEVGTQVSGVIEEIYVDYNSKVKANQLIAQIDKSSLQATVDEAEANLQSALNELEYQQKNYDRIKKLFDKEMVSETDYDEALYQLKSAKTATLQSRSDLKRAKTNLSYASIYSPIDGVVISRDVEEGQTVAASYSTPELFTIAQNLDEMQVEADVDEADIGQVEEGQRVTFTVDAYPDDEFSGTITQVRLEPTEESNVITYTVIIKAKNPDSKLMPGLTASVVIYTNEVKDALTLEAKAINYSPDMDLINQYMANMAESDTPPAPTEAPKNVPDDSKTLAANQKVVWVKKDKKLLPEVITTGLNDGVNIEIKEGLSEGDEVIYGMSVTKNVEETSDEEGSSPFMPKPPEHRKK